MPKKIKKPTRVSPHTTRPAVGGGEGGEASLPEKAGESVLGDIAESVGIKKRAVGVYPPKMRKLLKEVGSEGIHSLLVVRVPLSSFVTSLLNVISLGAYEKALRESDYDKMFHLSLLVNSKYTLEKNGVVELTRKDPIPKGSERSDTTNVPLNGKEMTIQEAIDKQKAHMGDQAFSNYDAKTTNCQHFVIGFLEANGLSSQSLKDFIYQDPKQIFDKMPQLSEKIGKFLTDTDAVVNKITEGEGSKKQRKPNPWIEHVRKTKSKHPKMSLKDLLKRAKETYSSAKTAS